MSKCLYTTVVISVNSSSIDLRRAQIGLFFDDSALRSSCDFVMFSFSFLLLHFSLFYSFVVFSLQVIKCKFSNEMLVCEYVTG